MENKQRYSLNNSNHNECIEEEVLSQGNYWQYQFDQILYRLLDYIENAINNKSLFHPI